MLAVKFAAFPTVAVLLLISWQGGVVNLWLKELNCCFSAMQLVDILYADCELGDFILKTGALYLLLLNRLDYTNWYKSPMK